MADFTKKTSDLALGRCATALAIFMEGRERLRRAPFQIGERVLETSAPWNGSWLVTGCELAQSRRGLYWRVEYTAHGISSSRTAEDLMSTPAGWVEPPRAPLYPHKLDPNDFGIWGLIKLRDADYQAQLRAHRCVYADWAVKHLKPLGYHGHTKSAVEAAGADQQLAAAE